MGYLKNQRNGIFILSKGEIEKKDISLLEFISKIIIDSDKGGLANNIKELEEEFIEKERKLEKNLIHKY